MKTIIFDIETGPLPADRLAAAIPRFDPMDVKTGNIKDPEKIRAKIEEARLAHFSDATERAALSALTGQLVAFGYYGGNGSVVIAGQETNCNEAALLSQFWSLARAEMGRLNELVGFNIKSFDLPFLMRRSYINNVRVPANLWLGKWFCEQVRDARDAWAFGDRMAAGSLDAISRAFGVGEKSGSGADFARLWVHDREKAVAYLTNDVLLTVRVAERMGVVETEGEDY